MLIPEPVRHSRGVSFIVAVSLSLTLPGTSLAHPLNDLTTGPGGWNLDPVVLLNLLLLGVLYHRGVDRLWRYGTGRGVTAWQVVAFAAGLVLLAGSLISPLDAWAEDLSSAHMVQHMALMNLAVPLMVLGSPTLVLLSGTPPPYRRSIGRLWGRLDVGTGPAALLWNPVVVWVVYALCLWVWHLPPFYQAALRDPVVHDVQHLTFFLAGCLFWRAILDPLSRRRFGPGTAVVCLFTTSLHATVLGVFMTLSPRVWYPAYAGRTEAWGLTLLEDQQLAGLIMWMPACLVYAIAAAIIVGLWIQNRA